MFQFSDSFLINIQTLKQSIKTSLEWMTFSSCSDHKPQGNFRYNIALDWFIWQVYHSDHYKLAFSFELDCRIYSVGFQVIFFLTYISWG